MTAVYMYNVALLPHDGQEWIIMSLFLFNLNLYIFVTEMQYIKNTHLKQRMLLP